MSTICLRRDEYLVQEKSATSGPFQQRHSRSWTEGAIGQSFILRPVKDAARCLGISVWTLRRKAYEGEVTSVKIGAKLLIPEMKASLSG
jgi:hypothetical protein